MKWLAVVLSSFVASIGAIGVVWPAALLGIARLFQTPSGLYAAAALRIVLGGALVVAAPGSRTPTALRAIGIVIVVAGLITPFIGPERARALLDWGSAQGPFFVRVWAGFALAFGGFLAWALLPKSSAAR